jgi:4-diphosphocytidyl-2-C-methyl-D-erythritol kinase
VLDPDVVVAIGADVPFCVVGGRARVGGIGELIEPLPPIDAVVTLLTPPFAVGTLDVYRAWDELGGPAGPAGNDLEPAALVVEPRLVRWRDALAEWTGAQPRLAGSGGTWFVAGDHGRLEGEVDGLVGATVVARMTGPHGT